MPRWVRPPYEGPIDGSESVPGAEFPGDRGGVSPLSWGPLRREDRGLTPRIAPDGTDCQCATTRITLVTTETNNNIAIVAMMTLRLFT